MLLITKISIWAIKSTQQEFGCALIIAVEHRKGKQFIFLDPLYLKHFDKIQLCKIYKSYDILVLWETMP